MIVELILKVEYDREVDPSDLVANIRSAIGRGMLTEHDDSLTVEEYRIDLVEYDDDEDDFEPVDFDDTYEGWE